MPATHALDLYRGDTMTRSFYVWQDDAMTVPTDISECTARAQIRRVPLGDELLVELSCDIEAPNLAHVTMYADDWTTAPLFDEAVWDLELTYPDGVVQTIVAGPVRASGDVSRPA